MSHSQIDSRPASGAAYGVSVIVCCHNSESRLAPTLSSLAAQRFGQPLDWEVIVVDNASTDATAEAALKLWPADLSAPLRVVREDRLGLSHARHRGFIEARFEYVSFIDDDNWVCEDWVQTVASVFDSHPDAGLCGGEGEAVFEGTSPTWFPRCAVNFAVGSQSPQAGYFSEGYLWGAGLCIRLSIWRALISGGFSSLLSDRTGTSLSSGGDTELCVAVTLVGWRQWFEPRLKYRHFMPTGRLRWSYLRRLYRGFGACSVKIEPYLFVAANKKLITTRDRLRRLWIWRLQAAFRDLFRRRRILWAAWRSELEGDVAVLHLESTIGRIQELLRNAHVYGKQVQMVREAASRKFDSAPWEFHMPPATLRSTGVSDRDTTSR